MRGRVVTWLVLFAVVHAVVGACLSAYAVLYPRVDSPAHVDAIVVVAGAADDRYTYSRTLAERGVANHILVSDPPSSSEDNLEAIDKHCAADPIIARGGREISVECFTPDVDTTEGETTAATRIADANGWDSLLIVTYWGHVSRVRLYFEQCFAGDVFVTDTPRPTQISRRYAVTHETGGYVKALLSPAC